MKKFNAKYVIDRYVRENNLTRIDDVEDLKTWIETLVEKNMDKPLFVSRGKGGGQDYKIMFSVIDPLGNNNNPCYFYSEMPRAISYLKRLGHQELQYFLT